MSADQPLGWSNARVFVTDEYRSAKLNTDLHEFGALKFVFIRVHSWLKIAQEDRGVLKHRVPKEVCRPLG